MKVIVPKNLLISLLSIIERVTGKKETLPVLSCVVLKVSDIILLSATNLEAGVECVIGGEIIEKGKVAVSASILSQTIRSIQTEKVILKKDGENLCVESKHTKTLIKTVSDSEFPEFSPSKKKGVQIERINLLASIQSVSYAASTSVIRPEIGSVYLTTTGKSLITVATDSFRLAEKTVQRSVREGEGEVLIPLKHALELSYILERIHADEVSVVLEESQMTISGGGVRFMSRVIDGVFPNYKEIIPKSFETEATLLKSDFSDILKKARIFSGSDQSVGFHLYPKRKVFSMTARDADIGEMSDTLDAALSGEDLDINFHIGYVAECLPSIESDSVTLSFSGVGKPLVIKGVSDSSFLYLVMPLNR
ncbi:DNA polymerase III subunit beta [Candidatus Kaiserbacteria bacterium RIFCSPHIGHO2_01_FULL_50_13]|uniref:Beta sliding clamp n=1 Tax=Candidatus Kaiserbacteria bacterium RIFCSPLOWO2_01_FULL_50_24 TaxID=1798507 RepID=A0A1F6ERB9_9BACT|nr:MAG: DNA polymerase III subunit beta [Candidatus Kaiserbacteria bacterium RIFCSPHIGHO2_01_FULL_50_13]OGG76164.1 MAG: DNA polymerase III subunit beta [Candidatus Kaiserbacteria bacterium RIFCSPLOWO2_01_FULL_50_24]OGG81159.1 MAG: DNA polymerase III subunit beta [Candidatus Kaiserbacteria bacterium RIFCSPLOWO2_02_FULL_51_13]